MTARLLGIGSALVDQLAHVPEDFVIGLSGRKGGTELLGYPELASLVQALPQLPLRAPGGSAANTVVGAARLGLATGFLTKIGCDHNGRFYRNAISAAGVGIDAFKQHANEPTGTCLSLITPDSQRTMRTFLGASATLAPDDISAADFAGFTHVHLEGYLLFNRTLFFHILQLAKQQRCIISLDLASPEVVEAAADCLAQLLTTYVDMVFANEQEAAAFAGSSDEATALAALAQHCPLAVLKLGGRGAWIQAPAQAVLQIPAVSVPVIDTTGAGDLWAAGFLYGLLTTGDLTRAGELAAFVAGEVVQSTGAVIADSSWQKIYTYNNIAPPTWASALQNA